MHIIQHLAGNKCGLAGGQIWKSKDPLRMGLGGFACGTEPVRDNSQGIAVPKQGAPLPRQ